jgi:dTDP-4-dehydrorhamnose 3,5-epimerase-like enzyme
VPVGAAVIVVAAMFPGQKCLSDPQKFVLSDIQAQVLHVPAGYVNGFRSLEQKTKLVFFSTSTLIESSKDDYRLPYDYFGTKIWEVESR